MSEVICISSSDDEEDISKGSKFKKNSTRNVEFIKSKARKRKESFTISEDIKSKKPKHRDDKTKYTNNDSSNRLNSSKNNFNSKDSNVMSPLKKPEFSKEINGVENNLVNVNNVKKPINVPLCMPSTSKQASPVRKVIKPKLIVKEKVPIPDPLENVFDNFIKVCKEKKNDEVTNKILENLKRRYNKLNPIDRDSEELRLFLSGSLQKLNNTDKFYSFIQEVQDEIKRRIKIPKTVTPEKKESKVLSDNSDKKNEEIEVIEEEQLEHEEELSEEKLRKVRKLEKAIEQCKKRIHELENQEINFDDEEDSSYLQEDRYKRKLVELCNTLAEIIGDKMLKREIYKKQLRRSDITEEMTGISSVDNAIIDYINSGIKKVNRLKHIKNPSAIADFLRMPDYPDIVNCISKCNDERDLGLSKKKIEHLACVAFKTIGRYLKKKRIKESEDYLSSLDATYEEDPAVKNKQLYEKLQKNKKEGDQKLNEVFKKFVDKQEGLSQEDLEHEIKTYSQSDDATDDEIAEIAEIDEEDKKKKLKKRIDIIHESDEEMETPEVISLIHSQEKKDDKNLEKDEDENVKKDEKIKKLEKGKDTIEEIGNDEKVVKNIIKKIEIKEIKVVVNKLESSEKTNKLMLCKQKERDENKNESPSEESNINSISSVLKKSDITVPSVDKEDEIKIVNDADQENTSDTLSESNLNKKKEDGFDSLVCDVISTLKENLGKNNTLTEDLTNEDSIDSSSLKENSIDQNIKTKELVDSVDKNSSSTSNRDQNKIDSNENNITDVRKCDAKRVSETKMKIENKTPSKNKEQSKSPSSVPQIKNSEIITIDSSDPSSTNNTQDDLNINKCEKRLSSIKDSNEITESLEIIEISESSKDSSLDTVCNETDKGDIKGENKKITNKEQENGTVSEDTHPFIKVCSFAKPPDSWKDSLSPEKPKQDTKPQKEVVLKSVSKPVFVDLTLPSTSKQFINPLAIKRVIPLNKMVVKKVINSTNQTGKSLPTLPKPGQPNVITIPKSSFNQRPNSVSASNIRTAYKIAVQRSEKSSN